MIRAGFRDSQLRRDLIELAGDNSVAHRLSRRATAHNPQLLRVFGAQSPFNLRTPLRIEQGFWFVGYPERYSAQ
jgi:hypothetical protein